jgi:hypothetical protein
MQNIAVHLVVLNLAHNGPLGFLVLILHFYQKNRILATSSQGPLYDALFCLKGQRLNAQAVKHARQQVVNTPQPAYGPFAPFGAGLDIKRYFFAIKNLY